MKTLSIQSGSNGNCIYYESGGTSLLFDAGISLKQTRLRLKGKGIDPETIGALFISHDHSDHARSMGIFQRGLKIPVFISKPTFDRIAGYQGKIDMSNIIFFTPGDIIDYKNIRIQTIKSPHDGRDPAVFALDDRTSRTGICTDLGHCFNELIALIPELDILYLESNFDPHMLEHNPDYPRYVKERIKGKNGHISNEECALLIKKYRSSRLKHLVLSHLSENNNTPLLALETFKKFCPDYQKFALHVAPRYEALDTITL